MKALSYSPSKDELTLRLRPSRDGRHVKRGRFLLRCDPDGAVSLLKITRFSEELEEFRRNRGRVRLEGLWEGVRVREKDIREARRDLARRLEERWPRST